MISKPIASRVNKSKCTQTSYCSGFWQKKRKLFDKIWWQLSERGCKQNYARSVATLSNIKHVVFLVFLGNGRQASLLSEFLGKSRKP